MISASDPRLAWLDVTVRASFRLQRRRPNVAFRYAIVLHEKAHRSGTGIVQAGGRRPWLMSVPPRHLWMSGDRNQQTASGRNSALCRRVLVHPDDLPDMAVEIVEAPAEHEPIIHRRPSFERAHAQSNVHQLIDLGLALQG